MKDHLPNKPARIPIEPWWTVHLGMVTEDDMERASPGEKLIIDRIIDAGAQRAGLCDVELLHTLYRYGYDYYLKTTKIQDTSLGRVVHR